MTPHVMANYIAKMCDGDNHDEILGDFFKSTTPVNDMIIYAYYAGLDRDDRPV